ncbi:hypothetical protein D1872_278210 [compost metagenome]
MLLIVSLGFIYQGFVLTMLPNDFISQGIYLYPQSILFHFGFLLPLLGLFNHRLSFSLPSKSKQEDDDPKYSNANYSGKEITYSFLINKPAYYTEEKNKGADSFSQ